MHASQTDLGTFRVNVVPRPQNIALVRVFYCLLYWKKGKKNWALVTWWLAVTQAGVTWPPLTLPSPHRSKVSEQSCPHLTICIFYHLIYKYHTHWVLITVIAVLAQQLSTALFILYEIKQKARCNVPGSRRCLFVCCLKLICQ